MANTQVIKVESSNYKGFQYYDWKCAECKSLLIDVITKDVHLRRVLQDKKSTQQTSEGFITAPVVPTEYTDGMCEKCGGFYE